MPRDKTVVVLGGGTEPGTTGTTLQGRDGNGGWDGAGGGDSTGGRCRMTVATHQDGMGNRT